LRYEIQNITPPQTVLASMEKQMTAERDKRAVIARSEGDMRSMINRSEGLKQELINKSEGEKQKLINEAEGQAQEVLAIARATAAGIEKIAASIEMTGGRQAVYLSLAQEYLRKIGGIARPENTVILPMDIGSLDDIMKGLDHFAGDKHRG
ncbi:MAG: paraslipin, partial [Spirochaetae bacterium HGW-Spirochaetae-10]